MIKIAVIFFNGTEEIESLATVDVLRRAKINCDIISENDKLVKGSHGIIVLADKTVSETDFSIYNGIVIPGGLIGAQNIAKNSVISSILLEFNSSKKLIASICASPALVLSPLKITDGKKVTCYPNENFISLLKNAVYTGSTVEKDGNLITANGPKSAIEFAIEICNFFNLKAEF